MNSVLAYTKDKIDSLLTAKADLTNGIVSQTTFLSSGGAVVYTGSGLTLAISSGIAVFAGAITAFAATTKTLGAAHATLDRFDAIVVNDDASLSVVAGTAAAAPSFPDLDPATQVLLRYISVPATVVTLNVTTTSIYAENTEWTSSVSGGTVVTNSATSPHAGTKCVRFTAAAAGAYARFTTTATSLDDKRQISLYINPGTWAAQKSLVLTWYNGTTKIGKEIGILNGAFGFNTSSATWQLIVIPISVFAIPAGSLITILEVKVIGGGTALSAAVDDILLESISTASTLPSPLYLLKSQLDADATLVANSDERIASQKAVKSYVAANAGSARSTIQITTGSLANNAQEIGSIAAYKSFTFLAVQVDRACRIRFYRTSAGATADAARAVGVSLTEAQRVARGLCGELLKSAAGTDPCFPNQPTFSNGDGSPGATLYYVVDNLSGSTHTVAVTITALRTES